MPSKKKRILVCPMDWGLGHATRVVPVIRLFLEAGAEVVLGADNKPLAFLRRKFPDSEWVRIPGFRPQYQKKGSLPVKMALAIPDMLTEAKKAHRLLEKIISEKHIDIVFSDNRYELWSKKAYTVFMTHQLNILLPHLLASGRPLVRQMMYHFIRKHDELWIPDFEDTPNLSGKLSHVKKMPLAHHYFIGPLSRFEGFVPPNDEPVVAPGVLCLLSGPEPQRTLFENILTTRLSESGLKALILSGKPDENRKKNVGNIEIRSHADDSEMFRLMQSADAIICRSGYSSLMDLAALGKQAVLIPTPGQPEQEYLARKMKSEGYFYSCSQKDFQPEKALEAAKEYPGLHLSNDYRLLRKRIRILTGLSE
jgi:uncharacterized protein (TIGR00661 family)